MKKIGRYQITRELGRGAMGVVYHAIDPTIGRPVAIKTLRLREVDDEEQRGRLRERLFREARSAGALSHPGIVTVYDMDEVDGLAYIAMEFVDGETLDQILSRPQALPKDRLAQVLRQAAAALDYAHRKGIIHRDIKPANIMIDVSGAVKITDFGIAKITQLEGQTLTGVLIGTPNYMSPEQVQGHEIDGRSDQFSLAVIAYEMLTGERPFYGEQISTVVYKIVTEQPVPLHNINTTLNEGVDKVMRKALAKKPERRFATCTAFATGLDAALDTARNWKVLPRKAQQNQPTASMDAGRPSFRPLRKPVSEAKQAIPVKPKKKGGWVFPFLAAFVILTGILALVAWQTGLLDVPWVRDLLNGGGEQRAALPSDAGAASPPPPADTKDANTKDAEAKPDTITSPEAGPDDGKPGDAKSAQAPVEDRPSPMPVASEARKSAPREAPAATGPFHDVLVMTDPAGAMARLDGGADSACKTPCKLHAREGIHNLTVSLDGYQPEVREVRMGGEDVDMPLISMRSANGILMLTTDPSGADVTVDGRPTGYSTPVRISLQAGAHRIAVQKGNAQASDVVEIRNGDLSTLKLTLRR
jgi:serine/threonine-protein kinase